MAQFIGEVKDDPFSNLQLATYRGASSVRGSDGAGLYYGRKEALCLVLMGAVMFQQRDSSGLN